MEGARQGAGTRARGEARKAGWYPGPWHGHCATGSKHLWLPLSKQQQLITVTVMTDSLPGSRSHSHHHPSTLAGSPRHQRQEQQLQWVPHCLVHRPRRRAWAAASAPDMPMPSAVLPRPPRHQGPRRCCLRLAAASCRNSPSSLVQLVARQRQGRGERARLFRSRQTAFQ